MILLTNTQMREMAKNICEQQDGLLVMCFNGNEVEVKYFLDYTESFEDDYMNGTGSSIIDDIEFCVNDVISHDEEIFFDEQRLKTMVCEYLTA